MAQSSTPAQNAISKETEKDVLQETPFQSILPILDDLFTILHSQSISPKPPGPIDASAPVADKAKELAAALDGMRKTAMALPGGELSLKSIQRINGLLDQEAEKRRQILQTFGSAQMSIVTEINQTPRTGDESVMPSPARGSS